MIGVVANPADHAVVREFFELFKTPWEFYRNKARYDVLLCAGVREWEATADLVIVYEPRSTSSEEETSSRTEPPHQNGRLVSFGNNHLPIYGHTVTFTDKKHAILSDQEQQCVGYLDSPPGEKRVARIGYDLFAEIRTLLTLGQPAENAEFPALELHIAFLRDLITSCGIPLLEIPPVPEGYKFIACLTHDVDHPAIRNHKWDHTVLGFLYRALVGSVVDVSRQRSATRLLKNWVAVLKLPLVYLGLATDFWADFATRYGDVEKGVCSTYFFIPFQGTAGKGTQGPAPKFRAARYGAGEIAGTIKQLMAMGCEVGLHGIDAWRNRDRAHAELEEIRRLSCRREIGVRMHWLYYDHQSPAVLDEAEVSYDSTVGYNETAGYRAGTTQVYKPLQATALLELPLHVMDTALFLHLRLSSRGATETINRLIDNAVRFGGCLTINWHDRSLAPERLWDTCYQELLQNLKDRGAWFATAPQAVSWFRKRRSVRLESEPAVLDAGVIRSSDEPGNRIPGLTSRVHSPDGRAPAAHQECWNLAISQEDGTLSENRA